MSVDALLTFRSLISLARLLQRRGNLDQHGAGRHHQRVHVPRQQRDDLGPDGRRRPERVRLWQHLAQSPRACQLNVRQEQRAVRPRWRCRDRRKRALLGSVQLVWCSTILCNIAGGRNRLQLHEQLGAARRGRAVDARQGHLDRRLRVRIQHGARRLRRCTVHFSGDLSLPGFVMLTASVSGTAKQFPDSLLFSA